MHNNLTRLTADSPGPLLIGVSGGSDSLALLYGAADWIRGSRREIYAATVDHGLRADAAREAEFVASVCKDLGIPHTILHWKNGQSVQARARHARHELLAAHAQEIGASGLLLGHTASDQVETFLIRVRAGSGVYGLAGTDAIAPSPVWIMGQDLLLIRPMLHITRQELRERLRREGVKWVDDPSNQDMHYERVRMRALMFERRELRESILRIQRRLRGLRGIEQGVVAAHLSMAKCDGANGLTVFRQGVTPRTLQYLLQSVGGNNRPIRSEKLIRAVEAVAKGNVFTLAQTRCHTVKETLHIRPENPRSGNNRPAQRIAYLSRALALSARENLTPQ